MGSESRRIINKSCRFFGKSSNCSPACACGCKLLLSPFLFLFLLSLQLACSSLTATRAETALAHPDRLRWGPGQMIPFFIISGSVYLLAEPPDGTKLSLIKFTQAGGLPPKRGILSLALALAGLLLPAVCGPPARVLAR